MVLQLFDTRPPGVAAHLETVGAYNVASPISWMRWRVQLTTRYPLFTGGRMCGRKAWGGLASTSSIYWVLIHSWSRTPVSDAFTHSPWLGCYSAVWRVNDVTCQSDCWTMFSSAVDNELREVTFLRGGQNSCQQFRYFKSRQLQRSTPWQALLYCATKPHHFIYHSMHNDFFVSWLCNIWNIGNSIVKMISSDLNNIYEHSHWRLISERMDTCITINTSLQCSYLKVGKYDVILIQQTNTIR